MNFTDILTFFALLLTAYSATQEYSRLKIQLIPSIFFWLAGSIMIVLFLVSFNEIKTFLLDRPCGPCLTVFIQNEFPWIWTYKYFFTITLLLILIVLPLLIYTKLRWGNQKKFLSLLHQLSKQENYEFLNRFANENMEKILSLRYKKTFQEQLVNFEVEMKGIAIIDCVEDMKYFMKTCCLRGMSLFSYDKSVIKQIADFAELEPNIKMNELMGYKKLEKLVELNNGYKEYSKVFLSNIFQNQNSFIVKQYLDEAHSNEYQDFLKKYCCEVELNINVGFAILEILKDSELQKLLAEKYDGKNSTVAYIHRLLSVWSENESLLNSMPTVIQKELLKYSKLEDSVETNAFFLLMRLFEIVCKHVATYYQTDKVLAHLYNGMGDQFYTAHYDSGKRIQIACHYFTFMMAESDFQTKKLEVFKKYLEENPTQKSLFIQIIYNSDHTLCEDEWGFGVMENENARKQWNQIKIILGIIPQETN